MSESPDLRPCLDEWAYDSNCNVRLARGADGRQILLVRQRMGLDQYEAEGRPDGRRPYGAESALDFHFKRLVAAKKAGSEHCFRLTAADCPELFKEATLYHQRCANFLRLHDWPRARGDCSRNLRLLDFVRRYAEPEEDWGHLEQWQRDIGHMHAIACAMIFLNQRQPKEALKIMREIDGAIDHLHSPEELADTLLKRLLDRLTSGYTVFPTSAESAFVRQGDYWTLIYHGQVARVKATRGLQYLSQLLHHPGQELHVSELIARVLESPIGLAARRPKKGSAFSGPHDVEAILDTRAKAEYKQRLQDLRRELEESKQLNQLDRSIGIQEEINAIAGQLAVAVGLGGRNRRTGSTAERARSAATQRIKESINKIAEVLPELGHHLAARIKTGYFCSYNPHPDRCVAWTFAFPDRSDWRNAKHYMVTGNITPLS